MPRDSKDMLYGCLIGGAIGDALGAPVENWPYQQIRDEFGKVEEFHSYEHPHADGAPGTITGDSVMRQYLTLSITEHEGRITPDELAETLLAHLNPTRVWTSEEIMIKKLAAGMNPWETGRGTIPAGIATTSIAPIGIINAANTRQAYQDGFNIASINQDGINRDAAAVVAAGIAEACSPNATVNDVLETMLDYAPEVLFRALELSLTLAADSDNIDTFVERFYDELLDWTWPAVDWDTSKYSDGRVFSADSIESLPAAVGILELCGDDPNTAITEAASFGRDCDTIGSVVGTMVGTLYGATAIRDTWITQCETANVDFFEELYDDSDSNFETAAERLRNALQNEQVRTERYSQVLNEIL
ncbi:ADP-ribosylglycohydrolase family protein [Haloplanus halobius]|uniref:ADP-ribosylglycohydrolase family protein n=1 Tax=Haloplanus halobius TaxID=2934938 RepID=UPI00200E029D|nr:ADP-ribosylglycohydrolase family protein [Haloplanus sp. XH21]